MSPLIDFRCSLLGFPWLRKNLENWQKLIDLNVDLYRLLRSPNSKLCLSLKCYLSFGYIEISHQMWSRKHYAQLSCIFTLKSCGSWSNEVYLIYLSGIWLQSRMLLQPELVLEDVSQDHARKTVNYAFGFGFSYNWSSFFLFFLIHIYFSDLYDLWLLSKYPCFLQSWNWWI